MRLGVTMTVLMALTWGESPILRRFMRPWIGLVYWWRDETLRLDLFHVKHLFGCQPRYRQNTTANVSEALGLREIDIPTFLRTRDLFINS